MCRIRISAPLLVGLLFTVIATAGDVQPQTRDGRWLRAGLLEYKRFNDKAEDQTQVEAQLGACTLFYIRGVLDATNTTVLKAQIVLGIANSSESSKDPKQKLPAAQLKEMRASSKYFAPLAITSFGDSGLLFDQMVQMISNFVEAHPEQWNKDADELILAALLDGLQKKPS